MFIKNFNYQSSHRRLAQCSSGLCERLHRAEITIRGRTEERKGWVTRKVYGSAKNLCSLALLKWRWVFFFWMKEWCGCVQCDRTGNLQYLQRAVYRYVPLLLAIHLLQIHGTWVAYEFVNGSPLSSVLTMRKTDGMPPLTIRANFEIMYQVRCNLLL